jgi:hypothetical protein
MVIFHNAFGSMIVRGKITPLISRVIAKIHGKELLQ